MIRTFIINVLAYFSVLASTFCQPMVNVAPSVGLNYTAGTTEGGSGASFVDFDKDGFDDLTIGTQSGDSILFFKNNGNGTFSKLASLVGHTGLSRQILWVDIDNDNDLDLYVNTGIQGSTSAQNRLYEKTATGLIDITITSGLQQVQDNSYGATFADFDKDGDLDLYVSVLFGNTDVLYRNNGNKTFTNINVSSGIGNDNLPDFCAAFFDYDNDGDVDLYTINDKYAEANRLYQNDNTGHFTEVGAATGANIAIDAMNAGVADFNNDGYFDVYVTNTAGNQLLLNNSGYFIDVAATSGVAVNQLCWGAGFFDVDNDKDLDLYVCSENAYIGDRNRLFKNKFETGDAIFEEYQSGGLLGDSLNSYVMANGDFNNDGKPDMVVVNDQNYPIYLWKNNIVNNKNYVKLKLEGTTSNKNAVGTLIKIYDGDSVQYRYTNCGINFMTQNSFTEHIGMGTNNKIDSIIVKWPNGGTNKYYNLGVNQTFKLKEGSCLNHDYNFNNTSANKFNFNTTNLALPSNWSKGHVPLITEDVEIVNTGTMTNIAVPVGMTFNSQSLIIKGSINFENNGTMEVRASNGVGLNIFDSNVTFTNNSLVNIRKACGNSLTNKGTYIEKGMTKILKL